jgi:hypothetical protein
MPAVAKIVVAQALRKSPNMEPDSKIGQLNHRNMFTCRTSLLDEQVYTRRIYGKDSYCFLWLDLVPRAWASPISLLLGARLISNFISQGCITTCQPSKIYKLCHPSEHAKLHSTCFGDVWSGGVVGIRAATCVWTSVDTINSSWLVLQSSKRLWHRCPCSRAQVHGRLPNDRPSPPTRFRHRPSPTRTKFSTAPSQTD